MLQKRVGGDRQSRTHRKGRSLKAKPLVACDPEIALEVYFKPPLALLWRLQFMDGGVVYREPRMR